MMRALVGIALAFTMGLLACTSASKPVSGPLSAVKMKVQAKYPMVKIGEFTLLTDNAERDQPDAHAIVQAKADWPYAMHTKQRADFDAVLARSFTLHASDGLMDRETYLSNRLADSSRTKLATYDNVVLQIFGDHAIMTYHNVVESEPAPWTESMSWMDTFIREDGRWKISASRMIHLRELSAEAP